MGEINKANEFTLLMSNWYWGYEDHAKPYSTVQEIVDEVIGRYSKVPIALETYQAMVGTKEFFAFYRSLINKRKSPPSWDTRSISDDELKKVKRLLATDRNSAASSDKDWMGEIMVKLGDDITMPKLCLLQSFLRRQGRKERGKRTVLYRIQRLYDGWENDFRKGKILYLNRLMGTTMPEDGKTFLTTAEYHDSEKYRDMEITISVERNAACGANIRAKSQYEVNGDKVDQREVLLPVGSRFVVTKVEGTGKEKPDFPQYKIEMSCEYGPLENTDE